MDNRLNLDPTPSELENISPHITKSEIQKILGGIKIRNVSVYQRSLVHKSIPNSPVFKKNKSKFENTKMKYTLESNETLELYGDSVLQFVVTDYLYHKFPSANEGQLTKYRSNIVRSKMLARLAKKIGLKGKILMADQVKNMGGDDNDRFLEDAFEAFIGALCIDKGIKYAQKIIVKILDENISEEDILKDDNYKDILLRFTQNMKMDTPKYIVKSCSNNEFTIVVNCLGKARGKGRSSKKKKAEQLAAKMAIENLKIKEKMNLNSN